MTKKTTGLKQTLFRDIDPYGKEGGLFEPRLDSIRPDPGQPRRLMPRDISEAVASNTILPAEAMRSWRDKLGELGESSTHNLHELERLATSIETHGLINPITVRRPHEKEQLPKGIDYIIVTGERRYWAHVLLALDGRSPQVDENNHPLIKAIAAPEGITVRAHQLIENIMREDINAIEKAEGLRALRRELSEVNYSSLFDEKNASEPSPQKLVPWTEVSKVLGISDRYRIYMTSILQLPKEAQDIIAEYGLAEMTVRPIVQKLKGRPVLQIEALKQVVAWQREAELEGALGQAITGAVQDLVEQLIVQEAVEARAAEAVAQAAQTVQRWPEATRFRSKVRGTLHYMNRLPEAGLLLLARDLALDANYASVVDELHDLRRQLDALLGKVSQYQADEETK